MPRCYYCGESADTEDHVTPLNIVERIPNEMDRITYTVSACRECNCLLGPRWFKNVTAKKLAIHHLLKKRYAKLLSAPKWSNEEMAKLGYTLQTNVRSLQIERETVKRRIAHSSIGLKSRLKKDLAAQNKAQQLHNGRRKVRKISGISGLLRIKTHGGNKLSDREKWALKTTLLKLLDAIDK